MATKEETAVENALLKKENVELGREVAAQAEAIRNLREHLDTLKQQVANRTVKEGSNSQPEKEVEQKALNAPDNWFGVAFHLWALIITWYKNTTKFTRIFVVTAMLCLFVLALFIFINQDYLKRRLVIDERANESTPTINPELAKSLDSLGIIAIWDGSFTPEEDARLVERIRKATDIKLLGRVDGGDRYLIWG